ncbi:MAG: hypothetical protein FD129_1520 [bacterium]|nr:MAG: hypothetical protein FD129_1520 [bacterium]
MGTDRLLDALLTGDIDFVIVGGVAAVLHGSTLLTRDLDICIPLGAPSLLRLQSALQGLHTTDDGRLDCLGTVAGIGGFDEVRALSESFDLGGRPCRVLGLDGLIRAKEAMGRPHDLATVVQLKALREGGRPPG